MESLDGFYYNKHGKHDYDERIMSEKKITNTF